MYKKISEEVKIEALSTFIDDLNNERKPQIYKDISEGKIPKEEGPHLEELFETVRAVKRVKLNKEENYLKSTHSEESLYKRDNKFQGPGLKPRKKKGKDNKEKSNWVIFRRVTAIAAALILIFVTLNLVNPIVIDDNELGRNEAQGNQNLFSSSNIAYAMEQAYDELQSYIGTIEIIINIDEKEIVDETIKVKYKKPSKYLAIHNFKSGYTKKRISDGDKLSIVTPNKVTIDYSNPKDELWRYHIIDQIEELRKASEIEKIREEVFKGREVAVYKYKHSEGTVYHRVWVDKETKMPLKTELNSPDGSKLINQFSEIEFNIEIDDKEFEFIPSENQEVIEINKATEPQDIREAWDRTDRLLAQIPDGFELIEIGSLEENLLYDYIIKLKSENGKDFIDFYLDTSMTIKKESFNPDIKHGTLSEGWVEYQDGAINVFKSYIGESNIAEWLTENWELTIVSSLKSEELIKILEKTDGERMSFITNEDLEAMGIQPMEAKPGH